jgi:hypothetical protein
VRSRPATPARGISAPANELSPAPPTAARDTTPAADIAPIGLPLGVALEHALPIAHSMSEQTRPRHALSDGAERVALGQSTLTRANRSCLVLAIRRLWMKYMLEAQPRRHAMAHRSLAADSGTRSDCRVPS